MAANQVVSGSLLAWNAVPAVSRTCFLQRLHWNSWRVFSAQKPRWPQAGQVRPRHQRSSNSAARHAASLPNRSRNSFSLSPVSERRNPVADAISRPRQRRKPQKI
jgi:hypothetical protein